MLNDLFTSFENSAAEENFANAMIDHRVNESVRDIYMGAISNELEEPIVESQLSTAAREAFEDTTDLLTLEQSIDELNVLTEGSKNCSGKDCGGSGVGESDDDDDVEECGSVDENISHLIDLHPETDPKDVGSYFSNTDDVAAECSESVKDGLIQEQLQMVDLLIPDTEIE